MDDLIVAGRGPVGLAVVIEAARRGWGVPDGRAPLWVRPAGGGRHGDA
jgi:hypothetical protein